MKIAIIGTGHVGKALGAAWAKANYEVIFVPRDAESAEARSLQNLGGKITISSAALAASAADVVVLAIPWPAVKEAVQEIGSHLSGKVLIDCTNPVKDWPLLDHSEGSGGEQVARLVPAAKVVKAFNSTGFDNMQNPNYPDGRATMFYAGDDAAAKKTVHELVNAVGFEALDAGGLVQSQALEVLASFWGTLAYGQKLGRGIAFRLMRR